MRMRLGLMVGFGAGYMMGAKAGKERYDQLMAAAQRMWESPKLVDLRQQATRAVEQAGEMVSDRTVKLDDDDLPELLSPYEATLNPPPGAREHI